MKRRWLILTAVQLIFAAPIWAEPGTRSYDYIYDFWAGEEESVPAFAVERVIDRQGALAGTGITSIDDLCTGGGRIFIVDGRESMFAALDSSFEAAAVLKTFTGADGVSEVLTNPEGVFFHKRTNELFIADTGAERILVLDGDGYALKRIITRPANMTGLTKFAPSKIAVDNADRIYFVVQGSSEGIVELTAAGDFSRYYGVNTPRVNLLEMFWRMFATNAQREKMDRTFAPSFNNIAVDPDGFIYAVSYDGASKDKVFRLNPKGENVLIYPDGGRVLNSSGAIAVGDLSGMVASEFMAVAVNDYGVYAVLDRTKGRVFVYNFYGEMMTIINIPPPAKGSFSNPSGLAWFGDYLVAADRQLGKLYVYAPTTFGRLAFGAAERYFNGQWEESARLLEEAVRLNANYDLGYSGIGKYYLIEDDYEKALYYLKLGQNRTYYSKAFNQYRGQWLKDHFVWFALLFAAGIAALIGTEVRYHRKREGGDHGR